MLAVLEGRSPTIHGDGEQSHDFIYIENVADLTLRAAETPCASAVILNGGTAARITVNEVVRLLGELTGKKIVANYGPPREGDIRDSRLTSASQGRRSVMSQESSFQKGSAALGSGTDNTIPRLNEIAA
jgi:UDP-glucose 4-epimerase